jgi:GDPmannose 4,6-dehydratase
MWLMLQQETPNDYVIATGEVHSLKNFLDIAFSEVGIENWEPYIKQDEKYMRPSEVGCLRGNILKAQQILGWQPKTSFEELVKKMTRYDLKLLGGA